MQNTSRNAPEEKHSSFTRRVTVSVDFTKGREGKTGSRGRKKDDGGSKPFLSPPDSSYWEKVVVSRLFDRTAIDVRERIERKRRQGKGGGERGKQGRRTLNDKTFLLREERVGTTATGTCAGVLLVL